MFPIFAVAVVPYLVGKENLWYTSAVSGRNWQGVDGIFVTRIT